MVYNAIWQSYMEYGIMIFGQSVEGKLNGMDYLKKKSCSKITCNKDKHELIFTKNLLEMLNTLQSKMLYN